MATPLPHPGSWPLQVGIPARAERRLPERSPHSVPVVLVLKRVVVLACDSCSALARWAGGRRKIANVIHPPPTSSSNAPKTEKRLGRGAVKSGAWRAKRTPAHLGSAPELQTPKPKRMKPAE